jgi:hypothetical protein
MAHHIRGRDPNNRGQGLLGCTISIKWPTCGAKEDECLLAQVAKVEKQKAEKRGSLFKYLLKFEDGDERWTRLHHLHFNITEERKPKKARWVIRASRCPCAYLGHLWASRKMSYHHFTDMSLPFQQTCFESTLY